MSSGTPQLIKLHDNLVKHGYDVPDIKVFQQDMSDSSKLSKLHDNLVKEGYDLPDVNTFYTDMNGVKKKITGASPSPSVSTGQLPSTDDNTIPTVDISQAKPPMESDVVDDALKYKELKKVKLASDETGIATEDAQKFGQDADDLQKKIKDKGYDADELANDFKDFPKDFNPDWKEELLDKYKTNPVEYKTLLNVYKNNDLIKKYAADKAFQELDGHPDAEKRALYHGIDVENHFNLLNAHPQSFDEYADNIKQKQSIIDEFIPPGEDRDKAHERLHANELQQLRADGTLMKQEYEKSDLKDKLDANQFAGLKTLEIFDPEQYRQAVDMLKAPIKTDYEGTMSVNFREGTTQAGEKETDESIDRKRGLESIQKKLADIGRNNTKLALNRRQHELIEEFDKEQDPEKKDLLRQHFLFNQSNINGIADDFKKDDARYPLTAQLKFDDQVKQLTQKAGMNAAEYMIYNFGKGLNKTGESLENVLTSAFGSNEDNTLLQMQRLGLSKKEESESFLPTSLQPTEMDTIPKFPKEVVEERDRILNDKTLNEDQQKAAITRLVANYQDKIDYITNPNAGKSKNFFSKATLYGNAKTIGDIASVAVQTAALGAGGLSKMLSAAAPMFTTTQDDFYKQAVADGNPNPSTYANVHATIMALAGMVNPDINIVKRSLGADTALGKMVAGIDEKTWNEVVASNKGTVSKFANAATSVSKEAAKMGLTYGAGTSIANDLADKNLFDKKISGDEIIDHAVKSTKDILFNSAALLGMNAITNYKNVSPEQKAGIWELGTHPDISIQQIKDAVAKEGLPQHTADERIKVVKDISGLINKVPLTNDKGKPLTDREKVDYLYNSLIKTKADRLKSDLSPKGIEKVEHESLVADYRNELITNPLSNTGLETAKKRLEKALIPEKDEEGKDVPINEKLKKETEANLQAVDEEIEKRSVQQADSKAKEFVDTKLSVPIEGVDAQGIPIGDNVPAPTESNPALKDVESTHAALAKLHEDRPDLINKILDDFEGDYSIQSLAKEVVTANKKPFVRATDEQIEAIRKAKSPTDVLDIISQTATDENLKILTKVFRDNISKAPFLKFKLDLPRDRNGYAVADANASYAGGNIDVSNKPFWKRTNNYYSSGLDNGYRTILHEFTHAFTIDAYRNPKSSIERDFKRYIDKTYSELKANSHFKDSYGFKSPEEFIAEIMTNPEFRLSAPIYKSGVLDKIIEFFAKMFGVTKDKDFASDERYKKVNAAFDYILKAIPDIRAGEGKNVFYDKSNLIERLSEAYHKSKKDGNNPELVKAVEEALSPKNGTQTENNTIPEGATQPTGDNEQAGIPATETGTTETDVNPAAQSQSEEAPIRTTGVSHEALSKIAARLGLPEPERGDVYTPQEYTERGQQLLNAGADVEKVAKEFEEDGKISADTVSVAKAQLAKLDKAAEDARDKYGANSKEFKEARQAAQDWSYNVSKPMGTKWGEIGRTMMGETDLDTGSFVSMERQYMNDNGGKEFTPQQQKHVEGLVRTVKDLRGKVNDLQTKLTETIDKAVKEGDTKETFADKAKKTADKLRKLKGKEFTFKDENGNDVNVHANGITWNKAIEFGAKAIEKTGKIADGVAEVISRLKDTEWYKNFSDKDKELFEKQITDHFTEEPISKEDKISASKIKSLEKDLADLMAGKEKDAKEKRKPTDKEIELKKQISDEKDKIRLNKLFTQFSEKKDSKFSPKEVKAIWDYARTQYLDKGAGYSDMLKNTSKDLGLNSKQVRDALSQPKGAKKITDDMYRQQQKRDDAISQAKQWVKTAGNSKVGRFFKAIPNFFFRLKTFGHGTVGAITHAGMNIFRPTQWKHYFPFFIKQFKYAFGSTPEYTKAMEDLKNDPQFTFWQRAGLAVDPKEKYDDYQGNATQGESNNKIVKMFKRLGVAGDRGFNALKVYRLALAKNYYDRLSNAEKTDPETANEIAKLVNHATGTTEVKVPKWSNTVFFAPKLEISRWQGLITDPAKAVKTFGNWKTASPSEKAAAKIVAKNAGEKMATYASLLGLNAAILALSGSKQQVNFTNPLSSDWLKFKMGDKTLDVSGGTEATMRFIGALMHEGYLAYEGSKQDLRQKPGEKNASTIATQIRYKLSPFASTIVDIVTGTDAMGKPLPYSNVAPKKGDEGYGDNAAGIGKYILQQQTPIPISEGIRETIKSMQENGMSTPEIKNVLTGILAGVVSGGTGAKLGDEPKELTDGKSSGKGSKNKKREKHF